MSQAKGTSSWRVLGSILLLLFACVAAPVAYHDLGPARHRHRRLASDRRELAVSRASMPAAELEPLPLFARPRPSASPAGPPQFIQYGKLVGEEIKLDPSVIQTPPLPAGPLSDENASSPEEAGPPAEGRDDIGPIREPKPANRPDVPRTAIPATKAWPLAAALLEQLTTLAADVPAAAGWAQRVKDEAERIARLPSLNDPAAAAGISRLSALADEAKLLASGLERENDRSRILRAGYAVVRRVVIWDLTRQLAARGDVEVAPVVNLAAWENALVEVERRLAATGAAANWRTYLLVNEARDQFGSPECSPGEERKLAREMLHRLHSTQLSRDQEQFLREPPFAALSDQLLSRASETPDVIGLLAAIERHEHERSSQAAESLVEAYDQLRWSPDPAVAELAAHVNSYYRNANVRVALSSDLVNRMLPRTREQYLPVQDTILEAHVEGDSYTSTKLRLVLVPDPDRWNIGLEALGEVASSTTSVKGPARFYQNGLSFFRARKRVLVDRRGIRMQNAEADANANNNLDDFETQFDGIPLLGGLARAIARNQYEESQPAAQYEVEGLIVWRATSQLDDEVARKLDETRRDLQARLLDPLRKLDLEPTAVDLETTEHRLIGRYRLAGRNQVAANTPRPQAPGDSLLSVQIHETALNNALENLKLHGQRIELRELYRQMSSRFNPNPAPVPEDLPENVYVTFADEDPVRLDCHDGRVALTIRLKELTQEGTSNQWRNFTVRGYYAPVADQLDANLERDGAIELVGRLAIGDRVALSAIFGKVLSRNRKLSLVNNQIALAPELKDQQVTQLVIHDGWIGVAIGPRTPGRAAAVYPRREGTHLR
jgi:hypothetical protein